MLSQPLLGWSKIEWVNQFTEHLIVIIEISRRAHVIMISVRNFDDEAGKWSDGMKGKIEKEIRTLLFLFAFRQ